MGRVQDHVITLTFSVLILHVAHRLAPREQVNSSSANRRNVTRKYSSYQVFPEVIFRRFPIHTLITRSEWTLIIYSAYWLVTWSVLLVQHTHYITHATLGPPPARCVHFLRRQSGRPNTLRSIGVALIRVPHIWHDILEPLTIEIKICPTAGHWDGEYDDWKSVVLSRGGTAAVMTQNERTAEEHSTLEQQPPWTLDRAAWCVVWTVWPATTWKHS